MYTDSNTPKGYMILEEDRPIVRGFPSLVELECGQLVKLKTDGTLDAAGLTDFPLGVVTSDWKKTDDTVRVLTPFSTIIRAKSDGITATGAHVAANGMTGNRQKYKTAVATNWVSGIVLSGGADTADIIVGVLRVPYLKA